MESVASKQRNHNSQKNQEASLGRPFALTFKKIGNYHFPFDNSDPTIPSCNGLQMANVADFVTEAI